MKAVWREERLGGGATKMDGRLGEAIESAWLGGRFREDVLLRRQRGYDVLGMLAES